MIPDDVAKLVDWLPKKRYLELTGETDAAVSKRIAQGFWKPGLQYSRPEGGSIWISLCGVNTWAAAHTPEKLGPRLHEGVELDHQSQPSE